MSRDAITEIELARQKKQIEQTLEEASWDIPRLLKINARLVKEKHEQAEQIRKLKKSREYNQHEIARLSEEIHEYQEDFAHVVSARLRLATENKQLKNDIQKALMQIDSGYENEDIYNMAVVARDILEDSIKPPTN